MVGEWIGKIGERQRVDEMPINILRDVLTSYGANFENLDDETKKVYRNILKKTGVLVSEKCGEMNL